MPMPTAQRVASGVGARRVIYCVGNGVWVTFAMSVALVWPFASEDGYATAAGLVNRGCFALAFFAMAVLDAQGRLGGRYTLVKITAACAAVALGLLLAGGFSAAWPIYAAAAVLGVGNCCGFCQWLRILASQGLDVAKGLLLGGSSVHRFCWCSPSTRGHRGRGPRGSRWASARRSASVCSLSTYA